MFYVFTKDGDSVTVILKGKPFTVANDVESYDELVEAIKANDEERVEQIVMAATSYGEILGAFGDVVVYGGHVLHKGREMHGFLVDAILTAVRKNLPLEPLGRFMQNVLENPDPRAQSDLYDWCEAGGLPITPDGHIIAYKAVRGDYLDHHSASFDHSVGNVVEMDRDDCDPDPTRTCSRGLHFCSAKYLPTFYADDSRVLLVKIHPRDVVAFPRDYGLTKGRACRYEVVEEVAGERIDGMVGYYDPDQRLCEKVGFYENNGQIYTSLGAYVASTWADAAPWAGRVLKLIERAKELGWTVDERTVRTPDAAVYAYAQSEAEAWQMVVAEVRTNDIEAAEAAGYSVYCGEALDPEGAPIGDFADEDDAWDAIIEHYLTPAPEEPEPEQDDTIIERVERIENELDLSSEGTLAERLDAIDEALGLDQGLTPLIARIERAELQLNL